MSAWLNEIDEGPADCFSLCLAVSDDETVGPTSEDGVCSAWGDGAGTASRAGSELTPGEPPESGSEVGLGVTSGEDTGVGSGVAAGLFSGETVATV